MSIIFGTRQAEGQHVEEKQLLALAHATDRYAPDGTFVQAEGRVGMGFQPYHTHQRSYLESQPAIDGRGNMLTLDGRLDNYVELCELLAIQDTNTSDSLIALAAFERWGAHCFSQLIGDWAVALWSRSERSLYLARDPAGTRTLYFDHANGALVWSTYLETLQSRRSSLLLEEEYAAQFLCAQPLRDLTPYKGILAVPSAHFLTFHNDRVMRRCHWNPVTKGIIRYRSETEYEEQFFDLFKQSVMRRVREGDGILAELSGGIDSTSIVCMSDLIRASRTSPAERLLDTISYYDPDEASWNEEPYFSITEARRGKSGVHIRTSSLDQNFRPIDGLDGLYLLPGADAAALSRERHLEQHIGRNKYRVIMSGVGGDEMLGGVPMPMPELGDYLMSLNVMRLITKSIEWSSVDRTPLLVVLCRATAYTRDTFWPSSINKTVLPAWVDRRLCGECLDGDQRNKLYCNPFRDRVTEISNGRTWLSVTDSLPHLRPNLLARYEYRYPYLDRDLVDFLFRIPREQLLRPGQRRSLMRRSLRDVTPKEVLERKRKAFLAHGPFESLAREQEHLKTLLRPSLISEFGMVNEDLLLSALESTANNLTPQLLPALIRAIAFELWLRSMARPMGASQAA
jgi:asparagine synthase (glutamine-hydrolysing)